MEDRQNSYRGMDVLVLSVYFRHLVDDVRKNSYKPNNNLVIVITKIIKFVTVNYACNYFIKPLKNRWSKGKTAWVPMDNFTLLPD